MTIVAEMLVLPHVNFGIQQKIHCGGIQDHARDVQGETLFYRIQITQSCKLKQSYLCNSACVSYHWLNFPHILCYVKESVSKTYTIIVHLDEFGGEKILPDWQVTQGGESFYLE